MATVCEKCGNRTNEVKSGTGIEPLGIRIELSVQGRIDFSRDVLKVIFQEIINYYAFKYSQNNTKFEL